MNNSKDTKPLNSTKNQNLIDSINKELFKNIQGRRILDREIQLLIDTIEAFKLEYACNGSYIVKNEKDYVDMSPYGKNYRTKVNKGCRYDFGCKHQEVLEMSNFSRIKICTFY